MAEGKAVVTEQLDFDHLNKGAQFECKSRNCKRRVMEPNTICWHCFSKVVTGPPKKRRKH